MQHFKDPAKFLRENQIKDRPKSSGMLSPKVITKPARPTTAVSRKSQGILKNSQNQRPEMRFKKFMDSSTNLH